MSPLSSRRFYCLNILVIKQTVMAGAHVSIMNFIMRRSIIRRNVRPLRYPAFPKR